MRTTKHKLIATIPVGDHDLGAEQECEINFTFLRGAPEQGPSYYSGGQPADPDEIEFIGARPFCNGKPAPFSGAFADMQMRDLGELASDWLESDEGRAEAYMVVADDDEADREYAAVLRAEMRREDR